MMSKSQSISKGIQQVRHFNKSVLIYNHNVFRMDNYTLGSLELAIHSLNIYYCRKIKHKQENCAPRNIIISILK